MEHWLSLWISLSVTEQDRFLRFVQSPYHNADQRMITIAEWLLAHPDGRPSREDMHQVLFPEDEFEYFRISNVLSYFAGLIKDFLAYEMLRQVPDEFAALRLKGMQERNLTKALNHEFRLTRKHLGQRQVLDEAALYLQQTAAEEEDNLMLIQGERKVSSGLDESIVTAHERYVLQTLKRTCQWLNRRQMIALQPDSKVMEGFIQSFRDGEIVIPDNPLISLYSHVLEIFVNQEPEAAYRLLMRDLGVYGELLPRTDEAALYQYARNFCIRKSNAGDSEYLRALLEVYRRMIDRELIFFDSTLNPGDMKNIVSLGIILKEFDWTKWFLETHGHRIVEEHKKNALAYNQAHLEYGMGNYSRALNLLAQVELEDVFYALGARTILLKCYFENRDVESLYDHIHAFAKWLSRNRHLADSQKQAHKRLLKVVKMIHKYRVVPMGPKAKLNLKSRIDALMADKGIGQAGWLGQQWGGIG